MKPSRTHPPSTTRTRAGTRGLRARLAPAALSLALCCACATPQQVEIAPAAASRLAEMPDPTRAAPEAGGAASGPNAGSETLPARANGAEAFESVVRLSGGRRFEERTFEKRLTRNEFRIAADYPQLAGDKSRAAAKFNREVDALVRAEIAPLLPDTPDREKDKNPHFGDAEEYHSVTHKVIFATDEVVSVLFYVDGYRWGAAHGFHYPRVLNYDLKRGRVLKLADLFRPGSEYLETLSRICREDLSRQLTKHFTEVDSWAEGADPTPENYGAWVLTPRGLVVIFKEYQVASYAEGEPKVLIPYARLKEIINPRGVLAALAAPED